MPDEQFIGGFSAIPGMWIHESGTWITAIGLPPQSSATSNINRFREAVFYLEGNTVTVTSWSVNSSPVLMPDGSRAPQGSIGFSVEIGSGAGIVKSGDCVLHCFLRGEHGLERHITLPLTIDIDRSLAARRRVAFVDPVVGRDNADGSEARPWRTLAKALGSDGVGDGGLVLLARAGRYLEDENRLASPPLANKRQIEVQPVPGLTPDQVVITRSSRLAPEPRWVVRASRVHFKGVTVDLGKMLSIQASYRDYTLSFSGCRLIDPSGPNGPIDGSGYDIGYNVTAGPPQLRDGASSIFYNANGRTYLTECVLETYCTTGAQLYRNVAARMSTDSLAGGPGYDDVVVDGYRVAMERPFHSRLHADPDLIVKSVARHPSGFSDVAFEQMSGGLPVMGRREDCRAQIVSGGAAGSDALAVTLREAPDRLFLEGDWTDRLKPGNRLRYYIIWHSDFLQQSGVTRPEHRGMRNLTIFRYQASSPTAQLLLTQGQVKLAPGTTITSAGREFRLSDTSNVLAVDDVLRLQGGRQAGQSRLVASYDRATGQGTLADAYSADQENTAVARGKTLTGLAMALSTLEKWGADNALGQLQDGHRNLVLAQNRFISQKLCISFRNRNPGHGNRNHVHLFNIYSRLDADTDELPDDGVRVERCQFEAGKVRGKAGKLGPAPPPAARQAGQQRRRPDILSFGIEPLVPFDINGAPLSAGSPIGPGGD